MMFYADLWVYPDRVEVRQHGEVIEQIPVNQKDGEGWATFVLTRVVPQVEQSGWQHHGQWHRPRDNDELLATTFAWRAS